MNPEWAAAFAAWTVIVGGVQYLIVKLTIKASLADFMTLLNGTYKRTGECHVTMDGLQRQIGDLSSYTHSRVHELANSAHITLLKLEEMNAQGTHHRHRDVDSGDESV
jgi:hypothetical protein